MPGKTRLLYLALSAIITLLTINQRAAVNADTKVLHTLSLKQPGHSSRYEVISLKNAGTVDEELVMEGNRTEQFVPDNDYEPIIEVITEYRADANGYRAHFRIISIPPLKAILSEAVLKTATG